MKKLFLLAIVFIPCLLYGQTKMSCCQVQSPTSTEEFAMLSTDKQFVNSHPDPIPFDYKSEIGRDVMIPSADGKEVHIYEFKAAKPTNNYIFVIHEWYGLNSYIKQESEKLYHDLGNVNVIALDLYDKQVATNRDDASKYMQSVTEERAHAIINAAIKYVGTKAKIATIGWCFGGGWSLQTSLLAASQAAGCIMYYGMPEKDEAKLKTLKADVLGIFAEKDKWISPEVVKEFEENMKKAGKKLTVKSYNADHAFANPSNPQYDKESTADAYTLSLAFLKARLK
ncbi:dienelactone hydrolase family protein [Solitalea sp. MAHUQ-68]|uniref:Dienelactone hydrolase family protein n=1 Tax=Solitalea agri TaxID=2953739 RepID=A0A9X2FAS2_9SPHI|nr:dienelactone hydrolase family protein [Solitalea agri]MCO4293503.1 dienelactone hydrolase family protein [Solitalea agri]